MKRTGRWVLAGLAIEAALAAIYGLVERQRGGPSAGALSTDPPRSVDTRLPSLRLRRLGGGTALLEPPKQRMLLHLWATWCLPCREELPGLQKLSAESNLEVVALALDPRWPEVMRLWGSADASRLFLATAAQAQRLGVTRLPATLLVQADGSITQRFDGARDWADERFVESYLGGR